MSRTITTDQWRALRAPKGKARGKHVAGSMNSTERRYADKLALRPDVAWVAFEGITLRLAHDCRYTPDFVVMLTDGTIELHEVKGFRQEDAMIKIRVAASAYPFVFRLCEYAKATGWTVTEIKAEPLNPVAKDDSK